MNKIRRFVWFGAVILVAGWASSGGIAAARPVSLAAPYRALRVPRAPARLSPFLTVPGEQVHGRWFLRRGGAG